MIEAAGTVPWRYRKHGGIKVLLIRREKHRDWSFPKGKLDKGESFPAAAVRETEEEVGLKLRLGTTLGKIEYTVGENLRKTVQYWAAKVSRKTARAHQFVPNDEVRRVKWVPLEEVREHLTYPADRDLFTVFEQLVESGAHDTFPIVLLRHAKAEPEAATDALRQLRPSGVKQAANLVSVIASFGPKRIISSTAMRCLETVSPLAEYVGVEVEEEHGISQEMWEEGETRDLRDCVAGVVAGETPAVMCSHLPVLPDLAREIAAVGKTRPGKYLSAAVNLPTAAFSVFHLAKAPSDAGIVSVELYPIKL